MKLGAFVNITDPQERGDCWRESLMSVAKWADVIVVVDGNKKGLDHHKLWNEYAPQYARKTMWTYMDWPKKWSWEELPKHLNAGLDVVRQHKCDWAIRFDIDYVFPDEFGDHIKDRLSLMPDKRVATFQKFSSVFYNRFYQKGGVQLGLNLRFPDTVFGVAQNYTDLCVPIIEIESGDVPKGITIPPDHIGKTGLDFFNYDYAFKTEEKTASEFLRFSMAHKRFFGKSQWGETLEDSMHVFLQMMRGRIEKCVYDIPVEEQPSYIENRMSELGPEEFCYNGWGKIVDKSTGHVNRISHNKR